MPTDKTTELTLSDYEIKELLSWPIALAFLADYHAQQESEADAMGYADSADFHKARREAFQARAEEAKKERLARGFEQ